MQCFEGGCGFEDKYRSKQGTRLQYESAGLFAPPRVQVEEVEVNITDQGN